MWLLNTVAGAVVLLTAAGIGYGLGVFTRYKPANQTSQADKRRRRVVLDEQWDGRRLPRLVIEDTTPIWPKS